MKPTIFYFAHSHDLPRGGQKHTYEHVEILRRNGYDAFIYQLHPVTEVTWFDHKIHSITDEECRKLCRPDKDIVVVPEDISPSQITVPGKLVVFNKNVFNSVWSAEAATESSLYGAPNTVAAFSVSDHNAKILRYTYPNLHVERAYVGLSKVFRSQDLTQKDNLISFSAKNKDHTRAVCGMLKARSRMGLNSLGSFRYITLSGMREDQVVSALQKSLVTVCLSVTEGFGRIGLEALACGSLLVSSNTGPGPEFAPNYGLCKVGDLCAVVAAIESLCAMWLTGDSRLSQYVSIGNKIAASYTADKQECRLLESWKRIFARMD